MESARITQGNYPDGYHPETYKEATVSEEMLSPGYCMDGFEKRFGDYQELLQFAVKQDDSDEWFIAAASGIKVTDASKEPMLIKIVYDNRAITCSEEVLEDTGNGIGLMVQIDHKVYPLRDTAYKTLLDRAKVTGSALPKLPKTDLALVLNKCLNVSKGAKALCLLRGEKISAIHSGAKGGYSQLPASELLDALNESLEREFLGAVFCGGNVNHSFLSGSWMFPRQKAQLMNVYKNALKNCSDPLARKALTLNPMPSIRFTTSDVGLSGANIYAQLRINGGTIPIGEPLSLRHDRNADIADFEKNCGLIFPRIKESVSRLAEMSKVTISYPVSAAIELARKARLPKKAALEAIAMFRDIIGEDTASAHTVYVYLCETLGFLENYSESKRLDVEEALARMMYFDFKKYDLAIEPKW